jgi:hypothetical protein
MYIIIIYIVATNQRPDLDLRMFQSKADMKYRSAAASYSYRLYDHIGPGIV